MVSFKVKAPYQVMSKSQRAGSKSKEVPEFEAEEVTDLIRVNQINPNRVLPSSPIPEPHQKSVNDDQDIKKKLLESYRKLCSANQLGGGENH